VIPKEHYQAGFRKPACIHRPFNVRRPVICLREGPDAACARPDQNYVSCDPKATPEEKVVHHCLRRGGKQGRRDRPQSSLQCSISRVELPFKTNDNDIGKHH
jgi:hypothetical protein